MAHVAREERDALLASSLAVGVEEREVVRPRLGELLQDGPQARKEAQSFGTTSTEVLRLRAWLASAACTCVSMEPTGVSFIPPVGLVTDLRVSSE